MPPSKNLAQLRSRVAVTARLKPGSPELDAARRELRAGKLQEHIQQVVSAWPPLTDEQRVRLAELLAPAREAIRDHRLADTEHQENFQK